MQPTAIETLLIYGVFDSPIGVICRLCLTQPPYQPLSSFVGSFFGGVDFGLVGAAYVLGVGAHL